MQRPVGNHDRGAEAAAEGAADRDVELAQDRAGQAVPDVGVAAFSEVTVLIAGVANSLKAGATDWNPALGGTLMAAVDEWIGQFTLELRTATFLSGVTRSRDLSRRAPIVTGDTHQWIAQLGYDKPPRQTK